MACSKGVNEMYSGLKKAVESKRRGGAGYLKERETGEREWCGCLCGGRHNWCGVGKRVWFNMVSSRGSPKNV